ncbi:MAG: type I-E CRISPR-associated protein Cas7/Cse4/CasC [Planctomycetota bacterium]
MFIQIHMLQSMPPGNLNRDETGQPKKCIFGGVTRGRISSQCLKRNIRHSPEFKVAFGDGLANRTLYLPQMIADALKSGNFGVPGDELEELMAAIAAKFKKDKKEKQPSDAGDTEKDGNENENTKGSASTDSDVGKTGQLVFFPPPFASRIAELVANLRNRNSPAYYWFIGRKAKPKPTKAEEQLFKIEIDQFVEEVAVASKNLSVDIGLFGRMTTSDLVVNVEAACQVAHAISTHETLIESDYFTAMDDLKATYASTQTERAGAAFLGSGETETFFNSAVYYKYLNLDIDAVRKHLPSLSRKDAAHAAGVLVSAATLANPTGKQNSFAAHGVPELILVEVSNVKRPVSYANAFLQPVEGGAGRNLMTESAKALHEYIDSVAAAFALADVQRVLLAVGHAASPTLKSDHYRVDTLDALVESVVGLITAPNKVGVGA